MARYGVIVVMVANFEFGLYGLDFEVNMHYATRKSMFEDVDLSHSLFLLCRKEHEIICTAWILDF